MLIRERIGIKKRLNLRIINEIDELKEIEREYIKRRVKLFKKVQLLYFLLRDSLTLNSRLMKRKKHEN